MINKNIENILNEIRTVLFNKVEQDKVDQLIKEVLEAEKIVCCGAGRVGMAIRGFAMRLGHLGFNAYQLGDATVPSIGKKDLLIVASGSGETKTILDLVKIAKSNNSKIFLISGNPDSSMGVISNYVLQISAPSKTKEVEGLKSIQPMTSLNEQSLGILFDAIVLEIMEKTNETHDSMWNRHSNLE